MSTQTNIILAVTGATGAAAAKIFIEKSPAPVSLVYSRWGKEVYERECGPVFKPGMIRTVHLDHCRLTWIRHKSKSLPALV